MKHNVRISNVEVAVMNVQLWKKPCQPPCFSFAAHRTCIPSPPPVGLVCVRACVYACDVWCLIVGIAGGDGVAMCESIGAPESCDIRREGEAINFQWGIPAGVHHFRIKCRGMASNEPQYNRSSASVCSLSSFR